MSREDVLYELIEVLQRENERLKKAIGIYGRNFIDVLVGDSDQKCVEYFYEIAEEYK